MSKVSEAAAHLNAEFVRGRRQGDGCVPEADEGINAASRRLVEAVTAETGEAWLINLNTGGRWPIAYRWSSGPFEGYGPTYVLPGAVAQEEIDVIVAMEEARHGTNYDGSLDGDRIDVITARVEALSGHVLVWS